MWYVVGGMWYVVCGMWYVVGKSKIFVIGEQNAGRGNKMVEAWKRSERLGNVFVGLGDHSAH